MNPEFRRQLWLECGPSRVVTVLVALGAAFTLAGLFDPQGVGAVVANVALMCFVLLTLAWGAHRAGDSLLDELRDRTWDIQRMSALGPWRMTWGKLLGATSLNWIAGGMCLAVYAAAARGDGAATLLATLVMAVAGAVLVQALALVGALAVASTTARAKAGIGGRVVALLVALWAAYFTLLTREADSVVWYGQHYAKGPFLAAMLCLLAAWAVLGAYRMMREALQVASRPWAWPLFLLFLTLLMGGGYIEIGNWPAPRAARLLAALALATTLAAAYLTAFALQRDPLMPRRLHEHWRAGAVGRFWEETPLWLVSLLCALTATALCVALAATPGAGTSAARLENVGLSAIPLLLYAVRDLAILFALGSSGRTDRAELGAVTYLALIYWLVPSILEAISLTGAARLFRPPPWDRPLFATAVLSIHVAVCAGWAWRCSARRPPAR